MMLHARCNAWRPDDMIPDPSWRIQAGASGFSKMRLMWERESETEELEV
jgi:hypothetical protein